MRDKKYKFEKEWNLFCSENEITFKRIQNNFFTKGYYINLNSHYTIRVQ